MCTEDSFKSTTNKNAKGATGYNRNSVEACRSQCLSLASCVAFDFDSISAGDKCWIHTDNVKANILSDAPGVTHYLREKCQTSAGKFKHMNKDN